MKEMRRRRKRNLGFCAEKEWRKQEASVQKPSSEAAEETLSVGGEEMQRKVQTHNFLGQRSVRTEGQMRVTPEN